MVEPHPEQEQYRAKVEDKLRDIFSQVSGLPASFVIATQILKPTSQPTDLGIRKAMMMELIVAMSIDPIVGWDQVAMYQKLVTALRQSIADSPITADEDLIYKALIHVAETAYMKYRAVTDSLEDGLGDAAN